MTRWVLASVLFAAMIPPLAARADAPPDKGEKPEKLDVAKELRSLVAWQGRLQTDFSENTRLLLREAEQLGKSTRPEEQDRAKTLKQALEKVKEEGIDKAFEKSVAALKAAEPDDAASLEKARDATGDLDKRLRAALAALPRVPALMIDGSEEKPDGVRKDSFYLKTVFTDASQACRIVTKDKDDLDSLDLSVGRFSAVYLFNVPSLSEKAVKRLETYVEEGGQVAVFVGDKVQAPVYNKLLYAKGKGIFPAPLAAKPATRPSGDELMDRLFEGQYQVLLRDYRHPVFSDVANEGGRELFRFLIIAQYWPTEPRSEWKADGIKVRELMTLPNRGEMGEYSDSTKGVLATLKKNIDDAKYAKYVPALKKHEAAIKDAYSKGRPYGMAIALDQFLSERGKVNDPEKHPDLKAYWELPDDKVGRNDTVRLRDAMRYGDPLVLEKSFGKGRTVVFLTTAGAAWNDWGTASIARQTYPIVMVSLQRYLTSTIDYKLIGGLYDIESAQGVQIGLLRRLRQQVIEEKLPRPAKP
jgi:hypothetical protein